LRLPADGTLIVAGAQEAIGADCAPGFEANLASLVAAWRKEGLPVVHARLDSGPAASFKACAAPLEGETVIDAGAAGAFTGSALEVLLDNAGATTLVVCGALSAVEQTARDAGDLGYQVFVPLDACWPANPTEPAFDHLSRAGATVVDTASALGAAATAKARQRREAERKR
jgi:nicotinamidase-related amidase